MLELITINNVRKVSAHVVSMGLFNFIRIQSEEFIEGSISQIHYAWYLLDGLANLENVKMPHIKEGLRKATKIGGIPLDNLEEKLEEDYQRQLTKKPISTVTPEVGFFANPKKEKRETTYTVNQTKEVENVVE